MCIEIACFPGSEARNFEINLIFQSSRFSAWAESQDKHLNILRTKIACKMK